MNNINGIRLTPCFAVRFTVSAPAHCDLVNRLRPLNHERCKEKLAQGLHDKGRKKAKKRAAPKPRPKKKGAGQEELF